MHKPNRLCLLCFFAAYYDPDKHGSPLTTEKHSEKHSQIARLSRTATKESATSSLMEDIDEN